MNYNYYAFKDKIKQLFPIENLMIVDQYSSKEDQEAFCKQFDDREKKLREIAPELVVYSIVHKSLKMSAGKIAGQCEHAIHYLLNKYHSVYYGTDPFCERMGYWEDNDFHTKVVLEASDKEWEKLKEEYDPIIVVDAGKTEIAAGSETVMILYPMLKEERSKLLKRLQTL